MKNKISDKVLSITNDRTKTVQILELMLSDQQLSIFHNTPVGLDNAINGKDISIRTGLKSKNISAIIGSLQEVYGVIESFKQNTKNKFYYRNY